VALGSVKHKRSQVGKARYRKRAFNIRVEVVREPTYVRGTAYGMRVKKEPAFRVEACVAGAGATGRAGLKRQNRCVRANGNSPTSALRNALAKLTKTVR
jgi:hypothetical protein